MPDANKTLPAPLPPSVVRLVELLKQRLEPEQIILFGSRARGDFRTGSDVDLCVRGVRCSDRDWNIFLSDVSTEPYTLLPIDLLKYEEASEPLKNNIDIEGIILYDCAR